MTEIAIERDKFFGRIRVLEHENANLQKQLREVEEILKIFAFGSYDILQMCERAKKYFDKYYDLDDNGMRIDGN